MSVATESLPLTAERSAPRALVHKLAIEQVMLTDSVELSDWHYAATGQLPRAHAFYNDTPAARYDPLLVFEGMRQAAAMICHRHIGVPEGYQFIFRLLRLYVTDFDALRLGPAPARHEIQLRLDKRRVRRERLVGGELRMRSAVDGRPAVEAVGGLSFVSAELYERMRAAAPPDPGPQEPLPARIESAVVGRADPSNVVITPLPDAPEGSPAVATVVVDRSHTTFFDHPLDHVPGMLLIEAFRQAALALSARRGLIRPDEAGLAECEVEFERVAEYAEPLRCEVAVADGSRADLTGAILQGADRVASGRIRLCRVAP